MTKRTKRETPAIEDVTFEASDDLGALMRIDYIDGSYRLERIPLLTRPAPKRARPSALRTTGDVRSLFVDDERVSVRCRCGTDNGGDVTRAIVCRRCSRLLATPERTER